MVGIGARSLWWIIRHAVAILVLPATVVVFVPLWIGASAGTELAFPATVLGWAAAFLGLLLLIGGGTLFLTCLRRFRLEGRGTLAPWDPPAHLVVTGPYAYVRNPMISGVILLLLAEALLLRSGPHLQWAGLFFLINAIYIPLMEEPLLKARFGQQYEEYRARVPRLIPRLRPWHGP